MNVCGFENGSGGGLNHMSAWVRFALLVGDTGPMLVGVDHLVCISQHANGAVLQPKDLVADAAGSFQIMAHHDHDLCLGHHLAHALMGFTLECQISGRQHLVDEQNFGVNRGGDAESQADPHAGAVVADWHVEEIA